MAAQDFKISLDMTAILRRLEQLERHVLRLGADEARRRFGLGDDAICLDQLIEWQHPDKFTMVALATRTFDDWLDRLAAD